MGRSRRAPELESEALAAAAELRLARRLLTLVHAEEDVWMPEEPPLDPLDTIPTEALDGLPAEASPPPIEAEDLLRGFLEQLPPRQRFILQARMAGRTAVEIAERCWPGRSERTARRGVARELTGIRAAWERFVLERSQ